GKFWTIAKALRLLRLRLDDVFDAGVEFNTGTGWYECESEGATVFRWVEPASDLGFSFDEGTTSLALLVEPGPAVGFKPFHLTVRLPSGEIAGRARIAGV